jgi:hypothetical protein
VHSNKAYGGSGHIAPIILKLGTRCNWVFCFRYQPFWPQGKRLRCLLKRRLADLHSPSGRCRQENRTTVSQTCRPQRLLHRLRYPGFPVLRCRYQCRRPVLKSLGMCWRSTQCNAPGVQWSGLKANLTGTNTHNYNYFWLNATFPFYWRYNPLWVCILQPSSRL